MFKKILFIFLILFFGIIGLFLLFRFISYSRDKDPYKTFLFPRVELTIVNVSSMSAEKMEMTARMLVDNVLPFPFVADSLEYSVFVDSTEVIRDRYKKSILVERNDSSWVSLPVTVLLKDLQDVIDKNDKKNIDSVEYQVDASFYTRIIFRKKINLHIKRLLPLIHLPEIVTDNLEIDSINFKRAVVHLPITIRNKNVFPLQAKDVTYRFSIEDNEWIEGVIPGLTTIPAKDAKKINIPMTISFKGIGKSLFKLLTKGKMVNYKLRLSLHVESEKNMMSDSKVIVLSNGTLKSLLKTIKEEKANEKEHNKKVKG